MTEQNRASLNPDTAEDGGAIPSGNLRVKESRFAEFDYGGKALRPAFTLRWELEDMETGETSTQHYSGGDPRKMQPIDDGKAAQLTGGTGFPRSSNLMYLMTELVNAGFPQDRLGLAADLFDGLEATFVIKPQPKRPGLQRPDGAREAVITVPVTILRLPWDDEAKGTGTAATDGAGGAGGDVNAKVLSFVSGAIKAQGGKVTKNALGALGFQQLSSEPARNDMVSVIFSDAFDELMTTNGFHVDGDTISE
jgi:hypothetical protein